VPRSLKKGPFLEGKLQRKIERMNARASAIDALIESGTLALPGGGDLVDRELRELAAGQAVEAELAALKAQLPPPQQPPSPGSGA